MSVFYGLVHWFLPLCNFEVSVENQNLSDFLGDDCAGNCERSDHCKSDDAAVGGGLSGLVRSGFGNGLGGRLGNGLFVLAGAGNDCAAAEILCTVGGVATAEVNKVACGSIIACAVVSKTEVAVKAENGAVFAPECFGLCG